MELQIKLIFAWLTFSIISGIVEAYFLNKNPYLKLVKGLRVKTWLLLSRTIVAVPFCLGIYFNSGLLDSVVYGLIFTFIFPFFNDGIYYTYREFLNEGSYSLYFMDQADLTDFRPSLNFTARTIFCGIGFLTFILYQW